MDAMSDALSDANFSQADNNNDKAIERVTRSLVSLDSLAEQPENVVDIVELSTIDHLWIRLINAFNAVYDPSKSATINMELLNDQLGPGSFVLTTYQQANDDFCTRLDSNLLGSYSQAARTMEDSLVHCLEKPFNDLRQLSFMFASFKTLYQSLQGQPLERFMDMFMNINSAVVTYELLPPSNFQATPNIYHAVYTVGRLKHFDAITQSDELHARREAFLLMIAYLKLYSDRIQDAQDHKNYSIQNQNLDSVFDQASSVGGGYGDRNDNRQRGRPYWHQGPAHGGVGHGGHDPESLEPSTTAIDFMNFILIFKTIRYNQPFMFPHPHDVMRQLMDLVHPSTYELTAIPTYDRSGDRIVEAKFKFFGAIFTAAGPTQDQAKASALKMGYKRLTALYALVQFYEREAPNNLHDLSDLMFRMRLHNDSVLRFNTKLRGKKYRSIVSMVHFRDFVREADGEKEAELEAFRDFLQYMATLVTIVPTNRPMITAAGEGGNAAEPNLATDPQQQPQLQQLQQQLQPFQ